MPLAFPAPALRWSADTEEPYAHSPVTPVDSTGPLGFAIDPAILREEELGAEQPSQQAYEPSPHQRPLAHPLAHPYQLEQHIYPSQDHYARDFPQGLPPEPQMLMQPHLDQDHDPPPPAKHPHKKPRRVKRPRREKNCGFCQGSDESNKDGVPEEMLSCTKCGRSGHPTCLDIVHILHNVLTYDWTCIECRACEICNDKGDDTKLLFCDNCDRGWHYDCLDPPLPSTPEGNWHCPLCPPPQEGETDLDAEGDMDVEASGAEEAEGDEEEAYDEEDPDASMEVDEQPSAPAATPKPKKKRSRSRPRPRPTVARTPASSRKARAPPRTPARSHHATSNDKHSSNQRVTLRLRLSKGGRQQEEDERKSQFESFLAPEEYDTTKSVIVSDDKSRFERSRVSAENKTMARSAIPPETPGASTSTAHHPSSTFRPLRSLGHLPPQTPIRIPSPTLSNTTRDTPGPSNSGEPAAPQLRIRTLRFGEWDIDTWYDAPFPEEYNNLPEGRLWMCEFCLKYMRSGFGWERHQTKCKSRHPPGDEIYRDDNISVFEVDGRRNKIYCQNLCLLSKMFLDHKSLFYDVEPFLFYVMTELDDGGAHFVGYFSKEKRSPKDLNLSCIMTLPVRQRKGWGNLLIDFSYLLSRKEKRVGTPERPLSALGERTYKRYWELAVKSYLYKAPDHVTFEMISAATGMRIPDIVSTLRDCNMLTEDDHHSYSSMPGSPAGGKGGNKGRGRPRGANNLLRRNSSMRKSSAHPSGSGSGDGKEDGSLELMIPPPGSYFIHWDRVEVTLALEEHAKKGLLTLKPEKLKWSPYLLARGQLMLKTDTAPEQPIAPSELPSHFSTHEVSALVKQKHSPGEDKQDTHTFIQYEPAMDISAVDQVAISGHAEAGPSRVSPSPGFVKNSETRSPTRSITPLVRIDPAEDQDRDSNFEPDEDEEDFQETPTRPRSRAAQQQKQHHQPSRVSARQLSSRQNSLVSESRSSANGRRTRASDRVQQKQKRGADQIDGLGNSSGEDEDGEGEEETEHDDTSPTMVNGTSPGRSNGGRVTRQNSSASLRPPPRKRNRVVSSPESSLLSEPPSSHTRISDMSSEDDTERDKTTSRALSTARRRGRPPLANGRRASVLSPEADRNVLSPPSATSRRTRSRPDGDAPAASPSISPSRRNSRRNGSAELSISHAPASSKHFKPPLDDPEAAVRNAKKARLNQALSAGVVISPTTSAARQPKTKTNGTTNGVSPEPEPREKIPSLETFMRDADSKGRVHDDDEDDLLDADAEGEVEEVLISLQAPSDGDVSAPYTPGVELDGDDADAEGELDDMDADAEGEVEEMDLDQ